MITVLFLEAIDSLLLSASRNPSIRAKILLMAFFCSISPSSTSSTTSTSFSQFNYPYSSWQTQSSCRLQFSIPTRRLLFRPVTAAHVCSKEIQNGFDRALVKVAEAFSEEELWAAACLRVRSFYQFDSTTFRVQDHKKYLADREFEALKERIAGKREGFRRVSCINATLPLSQFSNTSNDLQDFCKFSECGEDRVVVGTLDLNNCLYLPDEITGKKPEGTEAVLGRAYLSNVCVAEELLRNGLGYSLIAKSKIVAQEWGISDLYVHVAIDNIPAKNLYMKSGFIYESDEPAWQARYLERVRRLLLWVGLAKSV